jgi:hypothetical protein
MMQHQHTSGAELPDHETTEATRPDAEQIGA